MANVSLDFVLSVLSDGQGLILSYYKKGYVSGGDYPPMSYFVELLRSAPKKVAPNDVVALFHVSPDIVERVKKKPADVRARRGSFYEIGLGWVYPGRGGFSVHLVLNPRHRTFIRREYAIP